MVRICLILLFLALLMLVISGCDDFYPGPDLIHYSLILDGNSSVRVDNSLMVSSWGKAYYVSDQYIFHLGNKLVRRSMNQAGVVQMIPDNLSITDKYNIAIDTDNQLLYFAAGNAIYKISFDGSGMARISPDDGGIYSCPVLSPGADYLMAIRNSKMMRYKLDGNSWQEILPTINASYAVYIPETEQYYFFRKYYEASSYKLGLFSYVLGDTISAPLINLTTTSSDFRPECMVDPSGRYFAMKIQIQSWDGYSPGTILVYDRIEQDRIELAKGFCFAFSPVDDTMIYSRQMHGMADLNLINLDTRQLTLLWDGYISQSSYSYSLEELYWRFDGQVLHIRGYKGYRNTESKSHSAKLLEPSGVDR